MPLTARRNKRKISLGLRKNYTLSIEKDTIIRKWAKRVAIGLGGRVSVKWGRNKLLS